MNDVENTHRIDVEVVDTSYSNKGLEHVVSESAVKYADAMKNYDEAYALPRWDHKTRNSLQERAGRMIGDVILVGMTLDAVVPLTGDLHWFDVIMGEAMRSEDPPTS